MKKTAFVTGASNGIGEAIAILLAQSGYEVLGTYCHSREKAQQLTQQYGIRFLQADLSETENLPALAEKVLEILGSVDALVNNAACSYQNLFQCMPAKQVQKLYRVNLVAVVELTRLLLPDMLSRHHGAIVNIASVWGETGASCEVDYSVTKGGVLAFTKALAKEVAPSGIRVNAVSPGTIRTGMVTHLGEETLQELAEETPLGRLGTPVDVAETVAFLLSDRASYITGQDIPVNGGFFCP
jgi:3-oxoacyl-[acyl-carrier protein] reductase